jgi:penicillin-binding protein 2
VLSESNGAVIAIEPTTGVLVALVSRPAYDPDLFDASINYADYGRPRDDPDRSLFNCVLGGRYLPGPTIKPFMALAGLEYGVTSAD